MVNHPRTFAYIAPNKWCVPQKTTHYFFFYITHDVEYVCTSEFDKSGKGRQTSLTM